MPSEDFEVLQISLIDQTRAANNASIQDLRLSFDYLNPGDGFGVDVFGDETDEKKPVFDNPSVVLVKGDIIGATREPKYTAYAFSANRAPGYFLCAMGVMFCLAALGFLLSALDPEFGPAKLSPEHERIFVFLGAGFFAVMGSLVFMVGIIPLLGSEKIPAKLLSREETMLGGPIFARILRRTLRPRF